jgi:hypothetical protein
LHQELIGSCAEGSVLCYTFGTTKSITPAEHRWVLLEREGTMIEAVHPPIEALEERARSGDHQMFSQLAESIDWATRPPDELAKAVDLALELELATLAMKLAQQGGRLFPTHERLQQAARVLAPPVVIRKHPTQPTGLRESRACLREHAAEFSTRNPKPGSPSSSVLRQDVQAAASTRRRKSSKLARP